MKTMELDNTTTPEEASNHPPAGQTPRDPTLFYCSASSCGKFFNRKEHLTRHVRSSHSSHPQHECPICGRRYARRYVSGPYYVRPVSALALLTARCVAMQRCA